MSQEPEFTDPTSSPFEIFAQWYGRAEESSLEMPNAMTLATVDSQGRPNARVVLLKGWDDKGFCFFTNYYSQKGMELGENTYAAAVFWWEPLHRQIRIRGEVQRLSDEASDAYFGSRDRQNQIGAWASRQSTVIPNRGVLDHAITELNQKFKDAPVPRPPHWGGYRLSPFEIEFWQERPHRLHDRMVFRKDSAGWVQNRLSP